MTDATGCALLFGERTFVIVEVEREHADHPSIYQVADPDEVADLRDALNDRITRVTEFCRSAHILRDLQAKAGVTIARGDWPPRDGAAPLPWRTSPNRVWDTSRPCHHAARRSRHT